MAKEKTTTIVQGNGLVRVEVRCVGTTPLLQNRMSEETLLGIWSKVKKSKTASRPATPREEAEPKVYEHAGSPYIPVENLFSCWVGAGQFVRLDGKRQVSSAKSTVLPAFLTIESTTLPLVDPANGKPATWEVDIRQGRNPNGGEAVCLIRPRFDVWAFDVTVTVDLREIGMATVRELIEIGGKRMGLGDFRPQRKGPFGKYRIDKWSEVQVAEAAE